MPAPDRSRRLPARAGLWLALLVGSALSTRAEADESRGHPIEPTRRAAPASAPAPASSGGWWLGTAGIALALAAFGGISVASRKLSARSDAGPLRVVGRTSLSPKHAVYLLKAGDRTLIVGTGPQGSPTLLGELTPEPRLPATTPTIARFRAGGDA